MARRSFETAGQQIEFLAGAPVKDQIASLNWTVGEIDGDPGSYQRVVDEWMAADLAGLKRDANDPLQRVSPRLYDRLIVTRNRRWAGELAARLKSPGKIVVVVGIGHLIGPDGLPALLRARGFDVDGPWTRRPDAAARARSRIAAQKEPGRRIDPPYALRRISPLLFSEAPRSAPVRGCARNHGEQPRGQEGDPQDRT